MQLLDLTFPSPAENLACDEALLDAAEHGESGEVLRFWEASEYFVVVGYANKVATEVNVAACEAKRIPIFRRCSGGGTVLQGPGCLNYSLVLKVSENGPTRNITTANQYIMSRNRTAIQSAVGDRRSAIALRGHTDLAVIGQKFSGNSQRRRRHFLLFHGTFLLNFDLALISALLPMPSKQPCYRESRSHRDFLTNLNLPTTVVKDALRAAWKATKPLKEPPTARIAALVAAKYNKRDWNFKF